MASIPAKYKHRLYKEIYSMIYDDEFALREKQAQLGPVIFLGSQVRDLIRRQLHEDLRKKIS